jgi:hypothetical protein
MAASLRVPTLGCEKAPPGGSGGCGVPLRGSGGLLGVGCQSVVRVVAGVEDGREAPADLVVDASESLRWQQLRWASGAVADG